MYQLSWYLSPHVLLCYIGRFKAIATLTDVDKTQLFYITNSCTVCVLLTLVYTRTPH